MTERFDFALRPIGYVRSTLRALQDAPRQGYEGAPDAWLEIDPEFARGLSHITGGEEIIVITWLDRADRSMLEVHPRDDPKSPLTGVFSTRSADLRIGPIEAVDGTPVVDLKPVLPGSRDS